MRGSALVVFVITAFITQAQGFNILNPCGNSRNADTALISIDRKVNLIHKKINSCAANVKINSPGSNKTIYNCPNNFTLIKARVIDESTVKNVEWVYENDTLIYSEQTWLDWKKNKITDHERFYLFKNNLIAWFDTNNKLVADTSGEFKDLNLSLTSFAAQFIKR